MNTLNLYLSNLNHNYECIRKQLRNSTQCIGVVKANAYGGQSIEIAKRLIQIGIDKLAVAYAEEGIQLRNHGIKTPIMVFYPQKDSLADLITFDLEPCIYSRNMFLALEQQLNLLQVKNYPIHIKYNTGLNRVGFPSSDVDWVLDKIKQPYFKLESVYSHLAASEEELPSNGCLQQIEQFEKIKKEHTQATKSPPKFHLLNSSGIFNYPEYQYDAVRCGIALHGYANQPKWDRLLKPIAELKSKISQIHQVQKGAAVGYNNGWVVPKTSRIATLPLGHADGIGRHFGHHRASVLIQGKKAPLVGNICMDMLMIDISGIDCEEGDEVSFFGPSNSAEIFAAQGSTISYELLTGLGPRIKRIFHQ